MKQSPTISDFELGWLIGLLEGEGSFRYQPNLTARSGSQLVDIGMCDEDTIYKLASLMERLGIRCEVKFIQSKIANRVGMFRIQITGDRARYIMKLVVPHMSYRRRQQIWMALNKATSQKLVDRSKNNIVSIAQLFNKQKETA